MTMERYKMSWYKKECKKTPTLVILEESLALPFLQLLRFLRNKMSWYKKECQKAPTLVILEESLALSSFQLLRFLRNDNRELSTRKFLFPNPYFTFAQHKKGSEFVLFCKLSI